MNLKLKAVLYTLVLISTMFAGAVLAQAAILMFEFKHIIYALCLTVFAYIVYQYYSYTLSRLESLEKLNAKR